MDLKFLCCPTCKSEIIENKRKLYCISCKKTYDIVDGIPVLLEHNKNDEINPKVREQIWARKSTYKRSKGLIQILQIYLKISKILDKPLKNLKNKNPNILELGCGASPFFYYLQKKFNQSQIWGMDGSLNASTLLINNLDNSSSPHIICGNLFHSPFKPEKFDVVCSFGFIEHLYNPRKALEVHADLLKSGGTLICLIPNLKGLPGRIMDLVECDITTSISPEDVHHWLDDMGFNKITVEPVGGVHPSLFLESYYSCCKRDSTNEKIIYLVHKYFSNPLLIIINSPLMFRINSPMFSPFILAYGKKSTTGGTN